MGFCDTAGVIAWYCACLVAQGFSQVPGVDLFHTYAPVARLASIWVVLVLAEQYDFEIHQVNVKSARI
jgi:hypothetical protein